MKYHSQGYKKATYGLIAINLGFFILEIIKGGSKNINTLYLLGALVPQQVLAGEWWRLLTANFLHFGWLHLLSNMLGLYFLGKFVEAIIGIRKYLSIYFLSGIGTMFLFSILAIHNGQPEQLLVGASGAIMSLVGVISTLCVHDWLREKGLN